MRQSSMASHRTGHRCLADTDGRTEICSPFIKPPPWQLNLQVRQTEAAERHGIREGEGDRRRKSRTLLLCYALSARSRNGKWSASDWESRQVRSVSFSKWLEIDQVGIETIWMWRSLVVRNCDHFGGGCETTFSLVFGNLFATTMKLPNLSPSILAVPVKCWSLKWQQTICSVAKKNHVISLIFQPLILTIVPYNY